MPSAYASIDTSELVTLIRAGNHEAFAELVNRYTDRFFALAYRTLQNKSDAEDIVQTAFIKFWERPHLWNSEKARFTTWFYRVIIHACHDRMRGVKRMINVDPNQIEIATQVVKSEEELMELTQQQRWRQNCLNEGMRQLTSSQRDALNLVVYCELSQKQAAEILGISVKAIESLLVRAKRSLTNTISVNQPKVIRNEISHAK